ncbi:MAG: DUF4254 domain-containing protein [Bacteroidales bacterium]|jgi:hypothetical protein|nr:DUF4254 domain-containing protein [Bacteroidales bacterium]HHV40044.1 DUF4254 domain-containing protein [Bacteroidales bacterium]
MDMTDFSNHCNTLFDKVVADYHVEDDVTAPCKNPYPEQSLDHLLYKKCHIDTVQWHLEDIIRDPDIDPKEALRIKRLIDASNDKRTRAVEELDELFYHTFAHIPRLPHAGINTETPAWAVDRLSILALKIYHMHREARREDSHVAAECHKKWLVLLEQRRDLSGAVDLLMEDLKAGRKYMKLYKQMKMYNDPSLNPILYGRK